MEYQLDNDEVILFENFVKYGKIKQKVKLILTNKNLILEKEKGIFKKKMHVIEKIAITKIKIYKNKVQIKQKKNIISMQTFDKNIEFTCENMFEAKKVFEEIINTRTDSNLLDRSTQKVNNATNIIKGFVGLATAIAAIPPAITELNKRKKEIISFLKRLKK